jgi:hypothetical protein
VIAQAEQIIQTPLDILILATGSFVPRMMNVWIIIAVIRILLYLLLIKAVELVIGDQVALLGFTKINIFVILQNGALILKQLQIKIFLK